MPDPLHKLKENQFTIDIIVDADGVPQPLDTKTSMKFERVGAGHAAITVRFLVKVSQWGEHGKEVDIESDLCGVFDNSNEFFTQGEPEITMEKDGATNFIRFTAPEINMLTGGIKGEHGLQVVADQADKRDQTNHQ